VLKELVEYLARVLVDNPDAVSVEAIEDEKTTTLRLKVAQTDLGRVIGKQARPNLGDGRYWRSLSRIPWRLRSCWFWDGCWGPRGFGGR
jgi:hypothetical protein